MKNTSNISEDTQRGFSLVETLVAIAILLVALVGPMTIAAKSLQTAIFAREQTTASYLSQEGIELVLLMRDEEGLKELNVSTGNNGNFWDWRPTQCGNKTSCGIDAIGNIIADCSSSSNDCKLYEATSGISRYRHDATSNTATQFTREINIDMSLANTAHIVSVVKWHSVLFNLEREVATETFIYNVYGGF